MAAHVQIDIIDQRDQRRATGPQSFQSVAACDVTAAIMDGERVTRVILSENYAWPFGQRALPYGVERALSPILAKLRPAGVPIRVTRNGFSAILNDDWTIGE